MTTTQTTGVRDRANVTDTQTRANSKADKKAAKLVAAKAKADERQRINDEKIAERKAERQKALGEYETVGKQASSLVDKINREEDAALEQYNKHAGESTTLREHLAKLLADAEPICKAAGKKIKDLKAEYIGDRLGNTQFKQILRVARGAVTFQQIKQVETAKKQQQRAVKKVGTNGSSRPAMTTTLHGDGTVSQAPRATGNEGAVSNEARQAEMAKIAGDEPPTQTAELVETFQGPEDEPKQTFGLVKRSEQSVRKTQEAALQMLGPTPWDQFKAAIEILMPLMNVPTRAEARKYVSAISGKADAAERRAA